jgi:hypothetical protein
MGMCIRLGDLALWKSVVAQQNVVGLEGVEEGSSDLAPGSYKTWVRVEVVNLEQSELFAAGCCALSNMRECRTAGGVGELWEQGKHHDAADSGSNQFIQRRRDIGLAVAHAE